MEIAQLIEKGKVAIRALLDAGPALAVAFSSGKDSSCVALLTLLAAKEAAAAGLKPLVIVTTGNTLCENPEVEKHFRAELKKMVAFGKKHGFKVITKEVTPNLSSTWQIKVLSGRGLPSYAGTNADCSVDMKIVPQQTYRRQLFRSLKESCAAEPVVLIGTRYDESAKRAANMAERNESASTPVRNKDGELVLSPIAFWTTDDVWEAIGLASSGLMETYSDFAELKRIYGASESTSCAVVADAISSGKKRGGCGARTGCFVCQMAEDRSLENMVNFEPRYEYARGLVRYNKFLRAIRFDWSRRHWLGRTIKGGYIAVAPDTFHPSTQRELFRYMMQLDYDELQRARKSGEAPMFHLLPFDMIVAIDAYWSLNGFAKPFSAWADYRDIYQRRVRYDIPDIEPVAETPLPKPKYLHVGDDWDGDDARAFTGMRDAYTEALTETSACRSDLREYGDRSAVWDLDTGKSFTVDIESCMMLLDFELDRMLAKHDAGYAPGGVTSGYLWYIGYGVITLSHSQLREHDSILKRTAFKDRMGLSYEYDVEALLARSVEFADMPAEAQAVWSHKEGKREEPVEDDIGWVQTDMFAQAKPVIDPALLVRIPGVSYVPHIEKGWRQADIFELEAA